MPRARLLALAAVTGLLLAAPPARAQASAHDAVRRVSKAWRDGITPERMLALQQLAHFDDPECVDELLQILGRGEIAMFPMVRQILGGYREAATLQRLVDKGLVDRNPMVRTQVLLALGEARPATVDWLGITQRALEDTLPPVRAAAVAALGRARVADALPRILELASDPSERVRMEVPAALQRLAGPRALPALQDLCHDERWRVRLAAMQALSDLKSREALAVLAQQLGEETGRLREDIATLLGRLTGRSFGLNAGAWQRFVASAPPDILERGDSAALGRLETPRYAEGPVRYYSVTTTSGRFVLVTDLSGSMETPVLIEDREQPVPRLLATQQELTRLISGLSAGIAFDLVTFRDDGLLWKDHLLPADERNRRLALSEVDGYRAWGPTNVYGALAAVFDMAERAVDAPSARDEDLDTLFLLSDGVPTSGAIRDPELLLQYVAERNRTLHLRIHCLSLTDEASSRDFLQRLAALTGGQYVELVRSGT